MKNIEIKKEKRGEKDEWRVGRLPFLWISQPYTVRESSEIRIAAFPSYTALIL
jgi:hypothetical protein